MPETKLLIQCRIEEVPTIGGFLINSITTDLADFTAFSPIYNATYLTNANTQLAAIEALINPKQLTAELKAITLRIYTNIAVLRSKIDFLEGYIIRATAPLTIPVKDFGITQVRKANNSGDVEKLLTALAYLLTNANNNMAALTPKGYTATQHTALTTIKTQLNDDNIAQNAKLNERNNKVKDNYTLINDFWKNICTDISDAGKRIYKKTNKADDYTIAELKRRIRQEQKKNKLQGAITSAANPLNAKIVMIPVLEGRKRTAKTNAKGKYEIKSLKEGDYIVTATADGKQPKTLPATIKKGETTTLNFDLV